MAERNDLSGAWDPSVRLDDFSKDFLVRLRDLWQGEWVQLDAFWFDEIKKRFGDKPARECKLEAWLQHVERSYRRYAKLANISLNSVVDSLKVLQLPLDSAMGGRFLLEYDIKNENHAIVTMRGRVSDIQIIKKALVNPNVQVTARKTPPRKSPNEIACQWEFKLEVPEGTRVRGKDEAVDETTDIPELTDYSGPFYPNLTYSDLSKGLLLKLMRSYQYEWITLAGTYYDAVNRRYGFEAANECNLTSWMRIGERVIPTYIEIANIELKTLDDYARVLSLPPDSGMGLYPGEIERLGPNHIIATVTKCRSLEYFEQHAPEMIEPICHVLEKAVTLKYFSNPRIKFTALKLPPRESPEEFACKWDIRMEDWDSNPWVQI